MEHVNACDMKVRHVTFVFTSFPNCYTEATALTRGSAVVIFFTCSNVWFCLLLIRFCSETKRIMTGTQVWLEIKFQSRPWDLILEPGIERPCSQALLRFDHLANFFPVADHSSRPMCDAQCNKEEQGQMDSQHTSFNNFNDFVALCAWLLSSRTVATICSVSILSQST